MAIADDLVGHAHVSYLGDPFEQYCGLNGKPLIGGWIEVYQAGTDTKYITMQNFDGAMNPFKVPLNADGRVVMLADPSLTYDMYVRNSYGDLVCSRLNVECTCPGNISIKGADTRIKNTDGTLDISLQTMGNNVREYTVNTRNKLLDVQSPLYFVENSNTATVIGFDQSGNYVQKDYLADFVTSSISGKADTTAVNDEFTNVHNNITAISSTVSSLPTFSDVESGDDAVKSWVTNQDYATRNEVSAYTKRTDFDAAVESINSNKLDVSAYRAQSGDFLQSADLADYYKKTETSSNDELNAAFDNKLDKSESANYYPMTGNPSGFLTEHQSLAALMSANKLEYTLGGKISGYDGSAFAGGEGGSYTEGDYIDINGDIISVTGLQPSGDYLSATESANYYPMTGNPSGFLTEVPAGTLNESAFEYDANNKISGYNGSAFANESGGVVPEGVMAESGLEFNADNEISGYNGSAFAGGLPSDVFTLSAGSGVEIIDDQVNKVTTIAVTSQAGNPDVEAYVQNTSADIDATIINVSSNSGVWGGSALPISAGTGVKLDMIDDTLIIGTEDDYIVTTEETVGNYSVANNDVNISGSFSKTGYKPIAWTWKYSFAAVLNFNQETTNITDNTLNFQGYMRNVVGSDARSITFKLLITWVRV